MIDNVTVPYEPFQHAIKQNPINLDLTPTKNGSLTIAEEEAVRKIVREELKKYHESICEVVHY